MTLPTEKTPPNLTLTASKIFLHGQPGVGKTTLAANIDPDHTLLLEVEPGAGGVDAFKQRVTSWPEFSKVAAEIAKGDHDFTTLAVDTVDELFRMCQAYVMDLHRIKHPSDLEWGKGWALLADEWRLRIGKFAALGYGVLFVGHSKDEEIKSATGAITKAVPKLAKQGADFLIAFSDYVLYAAMEHTEDGERRLIRTAPSESWIAKSRIALPDPLPLDAKALHDAIAQATQHPPKPEPTAPFEAPDFPGQEGQPKVAA